MTVSQKMVRAYLTVAGGIKFDRDMSSTAKAFHRTKATAFFVVARRFNKDGILPDGQPYQELHTISEY